MASKYKFSSAQRWAVFLTHGRKCHLCNRPLDFESMEVDHIIPEHLISDPTALATVKSALGRPDSFELNSFENWMPACSICNNDKAGLIFDPSLLIQATLQNAAAKAEGARLLCDKAVNSRKLSEALNTLERFHESGQNLDELARKRMLGLLRFALEHAHLPKGQPLQLTQSFQLVATTVEKAKDWGVTHWSMPPREIGEPALVVLFRAEQGECVECGLHRRIFQPINQEGGGDPICDECLSALDWVPPVNLGDLPTHVTEV